MKRDDNDGSRPAQNLGVDTRLVTGGRDPFTHFGFVNPPVYHGSTVLYRTAADMAAHRGRYTYGRRGSPTSEALELALREIEGPNCAGVSLLPSGLSAVSTALLAVLSTGDHMLMSDSVYRPARNFSNTVLKRMGIETTFFDPLIGPEIADLFRPNTRAVYLEAPGSQSFEMQDVPTIAGIAKSKGAAVLIDNTWATPLYFRPLDKGVDLSIQAGTKYIVGHSDVMLGTVSANAALLPKLKEFVAQSGLCVGPDDIYLALRGLRTMSVRLRRHHESGLTMARWFQQRPEVLRVLHPGLEGDPGHAVWRRDFSGASGLFSVVLKPVPQEALFAFLDALTLFGMGASWGGFESLVIYFDAANYRTATSWTPGGPTVRFHIGLEEPADLMADLDRAFAKMRVTA